MRLNHIEAEGFKTFRQTTGLAFDEEAGLWFVQGKNLDFPSLGANGAGKSTLWDAMCWCLYGKTVRGTYGSAVSSWGGDGHTRVTLSIEVGGRGHVIERTRKPNSLMLDGDTVVQADVDSLLEMPYEAFLNTTVFGQFNSQFADKTPSQRLDALSAALSLDVWDTYSAASKDDVHETEGRLASLESELLSARAVQDSRLADLADIRRRDDEWLESVRGDRERLERRLGVKRAELEALSSELARVREEVRQKRSEEADSRRLLANSRTALENVNAAILQTRTDLRTKRENLASIKDKIEGMQSAGGACPGCLQPITEAAREHFCAEGALAAQKTAECIAKLESKLQDDLEDLERLKSSVLDSERGLSRIGKDAAALSATAASLPREIQGAERAYSEVVSDLENLEMGTSPYMEMIAREEERISEGDVVIAQLEAARNTVAAALEVARPWPKRFRQIRLWLLEEAVEELSALTASALSQLGLSDWEIEYRLEKENSAGKVTRSFEILVRCNETDGYVPWTSWSGGETQRLRLAVSIALSTLLRSRMSNPPLIEVWDEPTTHLNADGVDDLIRLLGDRAQTRPVYLVDHRALDQGIFSGTVMVTKRDGLCEITRS